MTQKCKIHFGFTGIVANQLIVLSLTAVDRNSSKDTAGYTGNAIQKHLKRKCVKVKCKSNQNKDDIFINLVKLRTTVVEVDSET